MASKRRRPILRTVIVDRGDGFSVLWAWIKTQWELRHFRCNLRRIFRANEMRPNGRYRWE